MENIFKIFYTYIFSNIVLEKKILYIKLQYFILIHLFLVHAAYLIAYLTAHLIQKLGCFN